MSKPGHILALSGGVGGAKLALGLAGVLPQDRLTVAVNTGDDFEHFGLHISPDIDTALYTLSGLANPETGWGRAGETWNFMSVMKDLGGESWFNLGDKDLALHHARTAALKAGKSLSEITASLASSLGIAHEVLPMSDDPVRTHVHTKGGTLAFQHYFVREQCAPEVTGFSFDGIDKARAHPRLTDLLASKDLAAIIICPSNPFVSVRPILDLPGVEDALRQAAAPLIAVSPIIGGMAIKGPAAKMMKELGMPVSALGCAEGYQGLIDGFIIDTADAEAAPAIEALGMTPLVTRTFMKTLEDREALARDCLAFADTLSEAGK